MTNRSKARWDRPAGLLLYFAANVFGGRALRVPHDAYELAA